MKSFSSSVINKSGKKFAPKAPARRAAPAPSAPPRRPSVVSQASASQTPQPATATPEPSQSIPTAEPSVPPEPAIQDPATSQKGVATLPKNATPIPVPQPKRKASFSATTPNTSTILPTPPRPSPTPPRASPTEPASESIINTPSSLSVGPTPVGSSHQPGPRDEIEPTEPYPSIETTTDSRPSKRPRTTIEATTLNAEVRLIPEAPQFITPPATQTATDGLTTEESDRAQSQLPPDQTRRKSKSTSRRISKDESVARITKPRKPRTRKKREPTPEDSEQVEIAPAVIKMSELCKDLRTGKKSTREIELRKMEQAELERKQKAQQEGNAKEPTPAKQNDEGSSAATNQNLPQAGPQMRIVNGEIVLDTASLQVDRHADAARNVELEDVIENSLTRRINQATYGKRSKTESWDEDLTDLFYRGLRMFGTDFMMISKLFPGRSRRQIKLKFNNEERRDPERIKETLLGPREVIDITTYSEMTNTIYDDPKIIEKELEEEKKRIEEQHAKEKQAQEELLRNPDGVNADGQPTQADKNTPVATKNKRNTKKSKNMGDGTEEIIGTIDDFP
ncbi:Transcription factor TFIIIB component B [Aspergillus nanangensis]|uniref:Transcription factor TFIIIB component B n=1 Tax=Aspergillus nanangensis TaxID=2582783 RepID=A0AAD4CDP8_ASPNN|nr:Transcription factor TFIIIB component B [Aspergillus nanangensis]